MSEYDGSIIFKEWLPDLPDLNNPGLTEATNVIPLHGTYECYRPLNGTGTANALSGTVNGAFMARASVAGTVIYASADAGASNFLFRHNGAAWATASATRAAIADHHTSFAQFEDLVLATDISGGLNVHTAGSAATFTAVSLSEPAQHVGVIGQFAVLGNFFGTTTANAASIRWSSIGDPLLWPTPGSATAIATQSGDHFFQAERGNVTAISGGDQFGLVFQQGAINRMTYVGGNVVFQFDVVDAQRGAFFPNSVVRAGGLTYFIARSGFFVTDGVTVKEISRDKISTTFLAAAISSTPHRVRGAYDGRRNLIYWSYQESSLIEEMQDRIVIYDPATERFTLANDLVSSIFTSREGLRPGPIPSFDGPPMGFMSNGTLGSFSGTPGTAILTTGEMEPNPGGYTEAFGIKPLVDASLNAITIAMGTRNDQFTAVSYSADQTANSRSGFANFRTSARYHRARLTIAGTFNAAQGLEYQAEASGYT
jgi:hypothetical protein